MKIKIIDDWLPQDIAALYSEFVVKLPHKYQEYSANTGDDKPIENGHLSCDLAPHFFEDKLKNSMLNQISLFNGVSVSEMYVQRFHTNMHFPDVGGKSWHADHTLTTAILNLGYSDGAFVYLDEEGNENYIEDKFNRLIMFDAPEMMHKGTPPSSNKNGPRINVTLKTQLINNPNS